MRNFLSVLALLTIAAIGVQASCVNSNCYHTKKGNFKIVHGPLGGLAPNDGVVYLWGDPDVVGPPPYEASICASTRSNNPESDPQQCYNGDHNVEKWELTGFSDTCSNVGYATVREVSGGTAIGVEPTDSVVYCDCYSDDD